MTGLSVFPTIEIRVFVRKKKNPANSLYFWEKIKMREKIERALTLAFHKNLLNEAQLEQIQKELRSLQSLEMGLSWIDLALGRKWIEREQLLGLLEGGQIPGETVLESLTAEEDRDLAIFLNKYNFINGEEYNEATEAQQKILQFGIYKKLCEIFLLKGWMDEESLLTQREIYQLLEQETYGEKKKVESSYGFNRTDLLSLRIVLQGRMAQRSQVLHCMKIQRSLYQLGMEQRLGEIFYSEALLDKDQIASVLNQQTKAFKEKGFALSSLIKWDEAKDKNIVISLQKYKILSRGKVEEALEIKNKLKLLGISRKVGEILLLRGDIKSHHVQKVIKGRAKDLLPSEGKMDPEAKSKMMIYIVSVAVAFLMMGFGVALEKMTHKTTPDEMFDDFGPIYSKSQQKDKQEYDYEKQLFSDKEYMKHIDNFAQKHPDRREVIIQKYRRFMKRYRKSPLVKKAEKEVKKLRSKDSRDYEKLVKKVKKIIKEGGKYAVPLAEDHIALFVKKYPNSPWAKKAKSLIKKVQEDQSAEVAKNPKNNQDHKKDPDKEEKDPEKEREEKEQIRDYLRQATEQARKFQYKKAEEILKDALSLPLKFKSNKKLLELAKQDMSEEEKFFLQVIDLLESKKDRISFYYNQSRFQAEKVSREGIRVNSKTTVPWPQVPLDLFARILKWKTWDRGDFYPLGIFLSTHHLSTLGYRYLTKIAERKSPYEERLEAYVSRLEDRDISVTGIDFFRDDWVRRIDYPEIVKNRVFYLEQWYDKRELLKQFGQSLAEKLKKDQMKEAQKELVLWRQTLYKERGVMNIDTMVDQGDPSKRVDVVLMCDGFTKEELPQFHELCRKLIAQLKSIEPFKSYWEHINVHRIDLYEKRSGIAGTDEKSAVTHLGSHVTSLNQLKCDRKKVKFYSDLAPDADLVVVVANVKKVRATGGDGVLCIDIDGNFDKRVVVGLGFAFANLNVEYIDPVMISQAPDFGSDKEYLNYNVTRESNPKMVKWHYWNYPPGSKPKVECVEGAYYREKGYYRPTEKCRMKSSEFDHYCVVCLEQIERSFYKYVSTIDSFLPILPQHMIFLDDRIEIKMKPLVIKNMSQVGGEFSYDYTIDGKPTTRYSKRNDWIQLTLSGKSLKAGNHTVSGIMRYSNKRVRRDLGVLEDSRTWELEVLPFPRPKIVGPKAPQGRAGQILDFHLKVEKPFNSEDFNWKILNPPARSIFDREQAYFQWCPGEYQRGAYEIQFEVQMKKRPEIKILYPVEIRVWSAGDNNIPFFRYQKPLVVQEGKLLGEGEKGLKIHAFDVDGDHLLYSIKSKDLPPGMELDANEGVLRWRPTLFQGGTYSFKIHVTDGFKGRTLPLIIKVENRKPDEKEKYVRDFGIFLGLRSPDPKVKVGAIKQLSEFPPIIQWMKWINFLRDWNPKMRDTAFETLQKWLDIKKKEHTALFLMMVEPYVMQLMDEPRTLRMIRAQVKYAKKNLRPYPEYCREIEKTLKKIDKYNEWRFKKELKKK